MTANAHMTLLRPLTDSIGERAGRRTHWTRDPAVVLTLLFTANFVFMRVSALPNTPVSVMTPIVLLWCLYAWRQEVLVLEPTRLLLWLAGAGLSAVLPLAQLRLVPGAAFSFASWALWVVLWLPTVFRLADGNRELFRRTCRGLGWSGFGMALVSLAFLGSQAAGVAYRDYFADFFPRSMQVVGFSTTAPIFWGSPIHKSNAWLALEPSFVSFLLAVALLAALVASHRWWVSVTILAGIFSSFAGSGLALLAGAVVIVVLSGQARRFVKPLVCGAAIFTVAAGTQLQSLVFSRAGELSGGDQSSTALRATLPYQVLSPEFIESVPGMLLGYGAGTSRRIVDGTSMLGLLVPNPAKLLFDYGLIAGTLLLAVMIAAHLRSPVPAMTWPILASFLFLQAATPPMITALLIAATWWAPADRGSPGRRDTSPGQSGALGHLRTHPQDSHERDGTPSCGYP